LFKENLRGIVRRSKVEIGAKSVVTDSSIHFTESGQFIKDFSANKLRSFSFFTMAGNDRGYGHGRFAGVFAVAQRQSKCGRKTCKVHVSQPVNIGVCYAVVVWL